ncbi:hypothetical protein GOODEAATRI_005227 [Goodea atripinnis]|uniref:Uncharacterized protein n=1 Tax=Goodea atripinnis TaxID=208336 RepID=A0ABV0PVF0_9TELE
MFLQYLDIMFCPPDPIFFLYCTGLCCSKTTPQHVMMFVKLIHLNIGFITPQDMSPTDQRGFLLHLGFVPKDESELWRFSFLFQIFWLILLDFFHDATEGSSLFELLP